MRYLLFLLLFFSFPLFAGTPYCSCYQVDVTDPYMRPPEMLEWLGSKTPCPLCFTYDCYGIDATGNLGNTSSLCTSACQTKNVNYLTIGDGLQSLWSVAAGDCSNPKGADPPPVEPPPGDPPPGDPPPAGDDAPFPCGYPGAQYLNCNVYDAKLERELKISQEVSTNVLQREIAITTNSVNALQVPINGVTGAINTNVGKTNTLLESTNKLLTDGNKDTKEGLEKIKDAIVHKDIKLTMGSCVEQTKLDARLPFNGAILSDALLTGFTCTGDQVYCDQIKLQAQAYCRDVISQRLQSLAITGGNVLVKCPASHPNPIFDDAGTPRCRVVANTACLLEGQPQPVGKSLPDCFSPITVTCPTEYTPIIVLTGFSCDTKLNAAKFNVDMDKQQKIIDSLNDPVLKKTIEDNKKTVDPAVSSVKTESEKYSELFKNPQNVSLPAFGVENKGSSIYDYIGSANVRCINLYAITICNPFDFALDILNRLIRPFISDYLYLAFEGAGGTCTLNMALVDAQLSKMVKSPVSALADFEKTFCEDYIPVIRALMSFFLTWYAAMYIFREANDFAIIVASGGSSVDMSATRLGVQVNHLAGG